MAPLAGPGPGLLRRRPLRRGRAGHAPGPGVRQGLRRRRLPARAGPAPRRSRRPAATRASSRAGSACPAGPAIAEASRSSPATSCSRGTPAAGSTSPTSAPPARLDVVRWAKAQGIDVTAEVTPHHLAARHRPALVLRPGLQGQPAAAARARTSGAPRGARSTAPSTRSPPTTPRTPGTTRSTPSSTRRSGCSASRRRCAVVSDVLMVRAGCSTGPASPASCRSTRPGSPGWTNTVSRSRPGHRPTSCSSTPPRPVTVDRDASQSLSRNNPVARPHADRRVVAHHDPAGRAAPVTARPHPRARGAHRPC